MSEGQTMLERYERGELPDKNGATIAERKEMVRQCLARVLADQQRLQFGGFRPSSFHRFKDNSGSPEVADVVRDGYFHMEEPVDSDLFKKPDAEIVQTFMNWQDG